MAKPLIQIILGKKLLRLREQSGMSQSQVARASRFSTAKLSTIENGHRSIGLFDVAGLCRLYNAPPELTSELERMSDDADSPSWWESFATYMLRDFSMCLELEGICVDLEEYEPELIPGLLQTKAYALAVGSVIPSLTSKEVEQAARLRVDHRQPRFWGRTPLPRVRFIIGEQALLRPVGSPDDAANQRRHLLSFTKRAGVDIRVLPTTAGPHASMTGGYTILTSGIPEIADIVYSESVTGARCESNIDLVARTRATFKATHGSTIPIEEYLNDTR